MRAISTTRTSTGASIVKRLWDQKLCILCVVGSFFLFVEIARRTVPEPRAIDTPTIEIPMITKLPERLVNILALGHRGLIDDFLLVNTLQYLAPQGKPYDSSALYDYVNHVLQLAPKIESLYFFSCLTLAMQYESPKYCQAITDIGSKAMPHSWRIPFTQGFVTGLLLGDQRQGAPYFERAATAPTAPSYTKSLAAKMASGTAFLNNQPTEKEANEALESLLDFGNSNVNGGNVGGDDEAEDITKDTHGSRMRSMFQKKSTKP